MLSSPSAGGVLAGDGGHRNGGGNQQGSEGSKASKGGEFHDGFQIRQYR